MNLLRKKQKLPEPSTKEIGGMHKVKILNIVSICIIMASVAGTAWFVYTSIYQTIGRVQTLLLLDYKPQFEPINFKLYNDTLENWDKKYTVQVLQISRNPFQKIELSIPSSTITTSTEEITEN